MGGGCSCTLRPGRGWVAHSVLKSFRMTLSLKPHHLKRYKDIAMLFVNYSGPDFSKAFEDPGALRAFPSML